MSREWKPGDVAMVKAHLGHQETLVLRGHDDRWHGGDGIYRLVSNVRPLVVIDPVSITGPDETGEDGDPLAEIAKCLRRLAEGDHPSTYRRRVAERLAEAFDPRTPTGYSGPYVVIDPEDREAIMRLQNALHTQCIIRADSTHEALQAALREFANPKPPKPEEPTGLGAVVEDTDGSLLVRVPNNPDKPWSCGGVTRWAWDDIDPARVLSKGVQP